MSLYETPVLRDLGDVMVKRSGVTHERSAILNALLTLFPRHIKPSRAGSILRHVAVGRRPDYLIKTRNVP